MGDFYHVQIRTIDGRRLEFSPATAEAAGDWLASLIAAGVLQSVGGWITLNQGEPRG